MSADRLYKWYVVVDSLTNEAIARELAMHGMAGESEVVSFTDNLGRTHSGWDVEYAFIARLEKSRSIFPFKFRVFVQEGKGAIREMASPVFKKKPGAKAKKAAEDLKKLKEKKKA